MNRIDYLYILSGLFIFPFYSILVQKINIPK